MTPTYVNKEFLTVFAPESQAKKALKSWSYISNQLENISQKRYLIFYKFFYKLEILKHNLNTIKYIIDNKGLFGFTKLIIKRFDEVIMMIRWITTDRSKITKDDDAILDNRKKMTAKELFND